MLKIFNLKNFKIACLLFAFLFLFPAVFKIHDFSKLSVEPHEDINLTALIIGLIFLIYSITIYFELSFLNLFNLNRIKIKKVGENSLEVEMESGSNINVHFNKIENIAKLNDSLIVLPANEYFDDECIYDKDSSLGAYVDKHFRNQQSKIQEEASSQLNKNKSLFSVEIKKKTGQKKQASFGIGSSVLLKKGFLEHEHNILLVSVTEQRAKQGIYSNIAFVYKAVNEVYVRSIENRMPNIYIPLIGTGHGGLNKRVAFLSLVTAFTELLKKSNDKKINSVNIVVFKDNKKNDIPYRIVKKILRFGISLAQSNGK